MPKLYDKENERAEQTPEWIIIRAPIDTPAKGNHNGKPNKK